VGQHIRPPSRAIARCGGRRPEVARVLNSGRKLWPTSAPTNDKGIRAALAALDTAPPICRCLPLSVVLCRQTASLPPCLPVLQVVVEQILVGMGPDVDGGDFVSLEVDPRPDEVGRENVTF